MIAIKALYDHVRSFDDADCRAAQRYAGTSGKWRNTSGTTIRPTEDRR